MQPFANGSDGGSQRPSPQPNSSSKPAGAPQKPPHNGVADVKPRLTKEQHDILESHFQAQHKPSTSTKKTFAENLGVPLDKINNWFQNRRAKVKQDIKKQINQYNMSMGVYGAPQMPMVPPQFQQHPEQPQTHLHVNQEYFPGTADISPTCLPVQSVEGPSALELGPQMTLQQPYDMHHSLRSIPEADRSTSYHPNAVMHSFMAATAGPTYACLPPQESGCSYDTSGLPSAMQGDLTFSVPSTMPNGTAPSNDPFSTFSEFSTYDYPNMSMNTTNASDVQNSTESISPEASPFSGAQSTETTQSSNVQNVSSVASIASVYSGWTEDTNSGPDVKPGNDAEDLFDTPYSLPQASVSEAAFWGPNGRTQAFSQSDMYQQPNVSAHAILSSPSQHERKVSAGPGEFEVSTFSDEVYARRDSSTSNLANNIEAIHIQNNTPDEFQQPSQSSSIAARRHKRPTALNSSTLRSASYTSGMPSPGNNGDHTLRRIRSSGITNATAGRVTKPTPGSAQRSPMTLTFADAAASPKFARTFSATSSTTLGQGGSLAPPTPQTPNETGRFPYWQSNTVFRNHPAMPDHSSPESINVNWTSDNQSTGVYSSGASPPSTPLDLAQLNQARLAHENLYRDTPPQSAPATQQAFPRTALMQPPQIRAGFHSSTDLTIAQPKPSHFRRPSLPEQGHNQLNDGNMQYPGQFGNFTYDDIRDMSLSGIHHDVPFAPRVSNMPDFLVHQYSPPQGGPHANLMRRTTEPQPKNYIFANQGPHDFRASS
ncbi:hypothetical protein K458DRAFT_287175 [Lentithecium fluviatile CBS 122367]|uniref:Homeobox domain-containing protein n=1 Tax=Lentithecium fluviatile CBS 122367 TaxID=1168545 RepID=A0A6G1JL98_9PLEO|nr:hypothetical protein K458DRAFT_287175 [Lentithecium fluviatile CBS 122367]